MCKAEGVTHEVFQYWEAKKPTENCALSTEHKSFRYPKDSETQRGSPTNFRGGIREKNSTEKSVINLLDMKFFDSRTFLIYQSVPQRNLSAPWDGKFSTENRDIPFSCINFFDAWHLKLSETLDVSSRSYSVLWDKKNRRKTVMCIKIVEIPNSLKLRSCSQESFAYCETKNFDWRTWFSVLMHRKFRYPNFSGGLKGLPTQFVSTVRPKIQRKIAIPPYWAKVFDVPKILKHRGVPQRILQAVNLKKGDKSVFALLGMKFCDSWTFEVFPNDFFWDRDKKISTENRDIPFFCIKLFDTWHLKLSETLDGSSRSSSGSLRQKNSKVNRYMHICCREPKYSET